MDGELKYDVVIVGGGPGGLTAARYAVKKGVSVLLIEKERRFGVKPCGEGVPDWVLRTMKLKPDPRFIDLEVEGAWLFPPDTSKGFYVSKSEAEVLTGYIVEKPVMLRLLASEAAKEGVDIMMGAKVVGVLREGGRVVGVRVRKEGKTILVRSGVLLGCDGARSLIAREVFGGWRRELVPALQYKMANVKLEDEKSIQIYFGWKFAPLGYLWVFPKGDGVANVGLGVRGAELKPYLDKFIKDHPEMFGKAQIVEIGGGVVDVAGPPKRIVDDGVALCGEAAGHVVPITGEGIGPSATAGSIAGEVAAEAVLEGDVSRKRLEEYPRRMNSHIYGARIRVGLAARLAFEGISDREITDVFSILSKKDFVNVFHGRGLKEIGLKLLRHPILAAKVARKLVLR